MESTHIGNRQVVSPDQLRAQLDLDGADYSPPLPYDANLEWDVARTKIAICDCMYPLTVDDEDGVWPDECPSCGRSIRVMPGGEVVMSEDND